MPTAGTDNAQRELASPPREKIIARFHELRERCDGRPLLALAGDAGRADGVPASTVLRWVALGEDSSHVHRRGRRVHTDDEKIEAVLRYVQLCEERPQELRYKLANEAGYPFGAMGFTVQHWARDLGVKLPPAPHNSAAWSRFGRRPGVDPAAGESSDSTADEGLLTAAAG